MTWKLVPTTPTDEMYEAAYELVEKRKGLWGWDKQVKSPGDLWSAMPSASPDPTTDEALVARLAWKIADALGDGLHGNSPGYINAARAAIRAMEEKP